MNWSIEENRRLAQKQTTTARQRQESLSHILSDSLKVDHKFDWDELKDNSEFTILPLDSRSAAIPHSRAA
jgi:hypothetical protein